MSPAIVVSSHMQWPGRKHGRGSASSANFYRNAFRNTWCRQHSFFSTGCPPRRVAKWTGERCPSRIVHGLTSGEFLPDHVRRQKRELQESGLKFLDSVLSESRITSLNWEATRCWRHE